jgi:hypothetical protein
MCVYIYLYCLSGYRSLCEHCDQVSEKGKKREDYITRTSLYCLLALLRSARVEVLMVLLLSFDAHALLLQSTRRRKKKKKERWSLMLSLFFGSVAFPSSRLF